MTTRLRSYLRAAKRARLDHTSRAQALTKWRALEPTERKQAERIETTHA